MHPLIAKTFGGLSAPYYFRHLVFGLLIPLGMFLVISHGGGQSISTREYVLFAINTLLYPYARYVYEGIIDFIVGSNAFIVNAFVMLITKFVTMMLCWFLAIFIAPVGLAYLFYVHSKARY